MTLCATCGERPRAYAYQSYCFPCKRAKERAYRQRNLERRRAQHRKWKLANPAKVRAAARRAYERRRGGAQPTAMDSAYEEMLRRDPCAYCGAAVTDIDHIVPVSRGGGGGWMNLTGACNACNRSKGPKSLLLFLLDRNFPQVG